jgi:hypothetical protein
MSSSEASEEQFTSGSSSSIDAGVALTDVEGGKAGQQAGPTDGDIKVRELLEPIGTAPGQGQLVLSFERLSVWAPLMPKKPSIVSRGWQKAVSCGKAESNPQRKILYDVTGQVRGSGGVWV